jgi:hypothetical protein
MGNLNELKYYRASLKINFKKYIIAILIAIISFYLIGKLNYYLLQEMYLYSLKLIIKASHYNTPRWWLVVTSTLLVQCLFILGVNKLFMTNITTSLRKYGQSRNKVIDSIVFIPIYLMCWMVSVNFQNNGFLIDTIGFVIFFISPLILIVFHTNYFCEKCKLTLTKSEFYTTSTHNTIDFLDEINQQGIDLKKRYKENYILVKKDVEINKCDTCGSQIVKIESKTIEVDSDGKKKIKVGKKITEDLLIS